MLSITPNRDIVIGCHFPAQQPPEWMDEAWPMPLSILIPGHDANAALNIHYNASAPDPRLSQHRPDQTLETVLRWSDALLHFQGSYINSSDRYEADIFIQMSGH